MAPVHPRGCGERAGRRHDDRGVAGSSPRVRGTHGGVFRCAPVRRFIPAGAGNAHAYGVIVLGGAVHPRGCGERSARACEGARPSGSSPRVRGTRRHRQRDSRRRRFIPAGAGNAAPRLAWSNNDPVHPRGCGERPAAGRDARHVEGSSPRVRGTLPVVVDALQRVRFIPAGAGNAVAEACNITWFTVHPRGCGERPTGPGYPGLGAGSSPRVRGTRKFDTLHLGHDRFIPAGAGNAWGATPAPPRRPVHPRGCGERADAALPLISSSGSSPRVRGTPLLPAPGHDGGRFIPAGAGNAQRVRGRTGDEQVHPRGCGERDTGVSTTSSKPGSSPRVRGTLRQVFAAHYRVRFIPAGAGNAMPRRMLPSERSVHPRGCGERSSWKLLSRIAYLFVKQPTGFQAPSAASTVLPAPAPQ